MKFYFFAPMAAIVLLFSSCAHSPERKPSADEGRRITYLNVGSLNRYPGLAIVLEASVCPSGGLCKIALAKEEQYLIGYAPPALAKLGDLVDVRSALVLFRIPVTLYFSYLPMYNAAGGEIPGRCDMNNNYVSWRERNFAELLVSEISVFQGVRSVEAIVQPRSLPNELPPSYLASFLVKTEQGDSAFPTAWQLPVGSIPCGQTSPSRL